MKTIRDIELVPDIEETAFDREFRSDFAFRCRFIGNYLRRQIKQIKFEPEGYNRIFISACESVIKPNLIFDNSLRVFVPYSKVFYSNLSQETIPSYFVKLYKQGIIKASETHDVPVEFLIEQLQVFENNNYLNAWEFKSKTFKEIGIKATLFCKMTMDYFSLTLLLFKKNEKVFSQEILKTLPDEIMYHYQFKDVILEDNKFKVLNEFKEPIYALDITFAK